MNFLSPTYNQIESKAVARMLGVSKAAKLDWTWYAVLGLPPAAKAIDTTVSKDGITGAFFSSKDRKAAVEEAEKRNRDALGLGDGPHPNLLKHLQANGDASTSFDSSLMSKFEASDAPGNKDLKLPEIEGHLFHQRPTLEPLFVKNSNVGKSLVDDLKKVKKTVTKDGVAEVRGFEENSPYLEHLKKAVKTDLAGTVRSPTIRETVLKTASPGIPGAAVGAITGWLEAQPAHGSAPATRTVQHLPRHSYTNAGGQAHELFVDTDGKVKQASGKGKATDKAYKGDSVAFGLANAINDKTQKYIDGGAEDRGLLQEIQDLLTKLKGEMVAARGEIDENTQVAKRLVLEEKLGMHAFGHSKSAEAATDLGDKSWKLLEGLGKKMMEDAKKADSALILNPNLDKYEPFRDLVKECGMPLGDGWFGAVGKSFDRIKQVFKSGNLRTRVQHVVNFSEMWGKEVFSQKANTVAELLRGAKVVETDIAKVLDLQAAGLKAADDARDAGEKAPKLDHKMLFADDEGNKEYTDAKKADQGPDMKFPTVPLEALNLDEVSELARRFGMRPRADSNKADVIAMLKVFQQRALDEDPDGRGKYVTVGATGQGNANPLTLSDRDEDTEVGLEGRENRAHGLDGKLPFVEGMIANIVNDNSEWIKDAKALDMPLRAGPSGTTFRTMNFAAQLSVDKPKTRLAMLGLLMPTNAHSFHEIMTAAQGHVPYEKKGRYLPLEPITSEVRGLAESFCDAEEVDAVLGLDPS